jgi:hypothetical protein
MWMLVAILAQASEPTVPAVLRVGFTASQGAPEWGLDGGDMVFSSPSLSSQLASPRDFGLASFRQPRPELPAGLEVEMLSRPVCEVTAPYPKTLETGSTSPVASATPSAAAWL